MTEVGEPIRIGIAYDGFDEVMLAMFRLSCRASCSTSPSGPGAPRPTTSSPRRRMRSSATSCPATSPKPRVCVGSRSCPRGPRARSTSEAALLAVGDYADQRPRLLRRRHRAVHAGGAPACRREGRCAGRPPAARGVAGRQPSVRRHPAAWPDAGHRGLRRDRREIARLAGDFGMRVLAVKARPDQRVDTSYRLPGTGDPEGTIPERIVGVDGLGDAFAEADFVSVTLPISPGSRGIVSRSVLERLRPHVWLVNTARGPVIDEAALAELLAARRIGGAALDVFGEEPLLSSSPFWTLPNVVLTPHVSGSSGALEHRHLIAARTFAGSWPASHSSTTSIQSEDIDGGYAQRPAIERVEVFVLRHKLDPRTGPSIANPSVPLAHAGEVQRHRWARGLGESIHRAGPARKPTREVGESLIGRSPADLKALVRDIRWSARASVRGLGAGDRSRGPARPAARGVDRRVVRRRRFRHQGPCVRRERRLHRRPRPRGHVARRGGQGAAARLHRAEASLGPRGDQPRGAAPGADARGPARGVRADGRWERWLHVRGRRRDGPRAGAPGIPLVGGAHPATRHVRRVRTAGRGPGHRTRRWRGAGEPWRSGRLPGSPGCRHRPAGAGDLRRRRRDDLDRGARRSPCDRRDAAHLELGHRDRRALQALAAQPPTTRSIGASPEPFLEFGVDDNPYRSACSRPRSSSRTGG